ncbi:GHMP kinase [Hanstruepera neustonica]|uniref:GHMP kinase n=1 Tax=Hanstruepera neustonica TaxID=1445657 RepID=A0A2K1E4L8_9FLAO|nr:GYDIA family GHMP kinase [Hanstruepera neustonica]PNQ75228.1 GHMP kinase [Hanstruepera neustonica]
MSKSNFYSNGKLLLTGEYLVLDGAKALALPTKYGQHLTIESNNSNSLHWKSYDHNEDIWFETNIKLNNLSSDDSNTDFEKRLIQILKAAIQLNPDFLNAGCSVETKLTFPKDWGLGSSSTLINNLAIWAQIDPYQLLKLTFGGSGYDIACASNNNPIVYSLKKDGQDIQKVDFNPNFKDNLYFVYLNKKQNSRDAIETYRKNIFYKPEAISSVNKITESIINCNNLSEFNDLVAQHEEIMGTILKQEPIKNRLFNDFQGAIKSLGAWGGDFILATATENPSAYFQAKGFETVIPFQKMLLS